MSEEKTYTQANNAKRAASRLIAAGASPSNEFEIVARGDDGFAIVWTSAPATTDEIESELEDAGEQSAEPNGSESETTQTEEISTTESEPEAAGSEPETAPLSEVAQQRLADHPDQALLAVTEERMIAELARRGLPQRLTSRALRHFGISAPTPTPAARPRRERSPATPKEPRRSKAVDLDALAATGVMPEKPIIQSPTNQHYQPRFDKLAAHAAAGEWESIRGYEIKGANTYAKELIRYRDRLLAAHDATPPTD